ncbi:MAG: ABC transporter substrate-binding protein [Bacteroidales bacterium]|nr:ABC transporter substrate-binding protein [Bacteroidales bacterium]
MKTLKLYFGLILLSLAALSLSCKDDKSPLMGADNYVISSKAPLKKENKRIVSVSTQITEIVCELGCMDRLVARTDFCEYPPNVKKIESIGGVSNPNVEKIISLQPDVVITSSMMPKKLFSQIENAGLPVISFRESNTIEGMYKVINIMGTLLQKEAEADSIINSCKERLAGVKLYCDSLQKIRNITKPKVYYVVGFGAGGDFSSGKDTYIDEMFRLAGADNIAKESMNWTFTKEQIFKNEPDYIFIRSADVEKFCNLSPYKELKAVKNHNVIGIDGMDAQTPRSIDLIEYIAKTIYGDKNN